MLASCGSARAAHWLFAMLYEPVFWTSNRMDQHVCLFSSYLRRPRTSSAPHSDATRCPLSLKDVSSICSYRFPRVEAATYPDVSSRERRDSDDGCRDRYSAYLLALKPSPYRSMYPQHIAYLDVTRCHLLPDSWASYLHLDYWKRTRMDRHPFSCPG